MQQELKNPELLSDKEIEKLLPELADVKAWIKKVEDYALEKANKELSSKATSSLKVVQSLTTRTRTPLLRDLRQTAMTKPSSISQPNLFP